MNLFKNFEEEFNKILNEEINLIMEADDDDMGDDFGGDDFGGDDFGGDDFGGDDFGGDDFGGDDGFGDDSDDGSDGKDDGDDEEDDEDAHEEDPEYENGIKDKDSLVLSKDLPQSVREGSENVIPTANEVISVNINGENSEDLERLKQDIFLIFTGKKLKPEDLMFNDIKSVKLVLQRICSKLDDRNALYLKRKMKLPLMNFINDTNIELSKLSGKIDKARDLAVVL